MEVCTLVDAAGFGPFCSGLIHMRVESLLYGVLVERWVGSPIPFDPDMTQWRYDWGGAGLATLYSYMSSVSRRKADLLGGYWRVWETGIPQAVRATYVAVWHASTMRILFEGPFN
ncbi:hypothetical protein CsSME_00001933 [Camellia sinensis var. sinensis]